MRGIIYKDYLIALMPKNIGSLLVDLLVSLLIAYFFDNMYGMALTIVVTIPCTGSSLLQKTMDQDEASGFDKLQLTFPLTKKQIVLSKYIGGLMMLGIFQIISLVVALSYYLREVASLVICFQVWIGGLAVGLFMLGICYAGFYLLGNKKGTILYTVILVIIALVYILTYFNIDVMSVFNIDTNLLLLIVMIVALIVLKLSFDISYRHYSKIYS